MTRLPSGRRARFAGEELERESGGRGGAGNERNRNDLEGMARAFRASGAFIRLVHIFLFCTSYDVAILCFFGC